MNKQFNPAVADQDQHDELGPAATDGGSNEISKLLAIYKRQKKYIFRSVIIFFVLGVAFNWQSVPKYTASTSVMIDSKQVGLSAASALESSFAFDSGAVDSQVLLIQSDRIASKVIEHIDLTHNQTFLNPPKSGIGWVFGHLMGGISAVARIFGAAPPSSFEQLPADIQRNVVTQQLQSDLKVSRNARTYVLEISYSNPDPVMARTVAATYASSYMEDQLEERFDVSRRASAWLDERIHEVKQRANAADRAVQEFRVKNKLLEASGRLINDQTLTDTNTQLSIARNDLNSAQAKYDRLKQIVDSKDYGASNLDTLSNPIISGLRVKYLDAYRLNSDISARISPQHESAVRARKDMNEISKVIFQEVSRLLESYESEVKIGSDRVSALEKVIESKREGSDSDSSNMAKLKNLENEAGTYNNLYGLYLQKAQDLLQQQSIPISNARIISDAEMPNRPSYPKTILIIPASLILGLLAGAGLAMLREFKERGFRVSSQVRNELGLEFTAYLPELPESDFETRPTPPSSARLHEAAPQAFCSDSRALDMVLEDPMSIFAEGIRSIKLTIDYQFGLKRPIVIGFVSTFPNEGKSTAAKNFASMVARQGEKVLLLDCDLRNPQLTRSLTPTARMGLLEALTGDVGSIDSLMHRETASGLTFLPASARGRVPATGDILSDRSMGDLVRNLRAQFNVIVVDLAPIGLVRDASAAATFVDCYHLIVEWGRTPRSAVVDALATDPIVAGRVVGVSLSKVDMDKLSLFDKHAAYGYGGEYVSRYYGQEKIALNAAGAAATSLPRKLFEFANALKKRFARTVS